MNTNQDRKSVAEVGTATFESHVLRAKQPVLVVVEPLLSGHHEYHQSDAPTVAYATVYPLTMLLCTPCAQEPALVELFQ